MVNLKNISDSIDYNIFDSIYLVPNASRGLLALGCGMVNRSSDSLTAFTQNLCVVLDWHDYILVFGI